MSETRISLGKLAYACHMYESMTDYGRSLRSFREAVGDKLDLTQPAHRRALLDWLNAWTCRINLDYLEDLSLGLAEWFDQHRPGLPGARDSLLELGDSALEAFLDPFDKLSDIKPPGARRRFGPTAASKALFALCPAVFVPWDAFIREGLVGGESGAAYIKFLKLMRDDLATIAGQCWSSGFDLEGLPEKIGRPKSTAAQLVGEYYWVTITRHAHMPNAETLRTWAEWS